MAQEYDKKGAPEQAGQETPEPIHPGRRPSLTDVPVTPGFHLGEYDSTREGNGGFSYFTPNPEKTAGMQQTPSQLAHGAKDERDVLRRMSLSDPRRNEDPIDQLSIKDPRAAHPELGLSGNVISATFAIPQSLRYKKGQDWVGLAMFCVGNQADNYVGHVK